MLATATPHSGDDTAFANLVGLCNPALATADLTTGAGRALLAQHFVQRRRADIRHYLDEDTPFPKDRLTLDVPYTLSPDYRDLFDDVLHYAREQVRDGVNGTRGRVRWWSALALLRALASSPTRGIRDAAHPCSQRRGHRPGAGGRPRPGRRPRQRRRRRPRRHRHHSRCTDPCR